MKIILHGPLADKFGREHTINTMVPADALEGLSRQLDWPREMAFEVLDFDTEDKLRLPTEVKEIHLVPAIVGGSGVGKIILGAVMIIAGVVLLGVPGGQPWGISLIMSGASMMLTGIIELFMKAPTVDKSEDPPASKYFGVDRNTIAIGTYRTIAYGRVQIAGHWLSIQVDESSLMKGSFPVTP